MYIKTSSLNINIIPWIKKNLKHQRPYRKYWFNIVDDKKDLKIWWDSPFKDIQTISETLYEVTVTLQYTAFHKFQKRADVLWIFFFREVFVP